MICTWTVQYHLHVGLQILLFVEVMICKILYSTYLFCRTPSLLIILLRLQYNVCRRNMRVVYRWVSYISKWKCMHAIFLASVQFLPYTVCYLIIVRYGQGGPKSFCKDNERLARNEAFSGHGLGKNGVWRDEWLYISSSRAERAKISSICPQASPKVVGNGERTRIEALLVASFDAENLADERSTSVGQP